MPFSHSVPPLLIWSRAVIGLVVVLLALFAADASGWWTAGLIVTGVLTDVFDGVVARALKISTDHLRKLDSRVDVFFFLSLVASLLISHPVLWSPVLLMVGVLAMLEITVHAISFVRFKKESSTHHYLSKFFSLFLFGLLIQLFLFPEVTWLYGVTLGIGILSFLESGLIMLTIREWQTDIRSYWHARRLR